MSDLYIDGAMLARVRGHLATIEERLRRPTQQMRDLDTVAVGSSDLEETMADFADSWSYGIGQLAKFSGAAVDALDAIAEAFETADTNLANALNQAKQ